MKDKLTRLSNKEKLTKRDYLLYKEQVIKIVAVNTKLKNSSIHINTLPASEFKNSIYGYCNVYANDSDNSDSNLYIIDLRNRQSKYNLYCSLLHELSHVIEFERYEKFSYHGLKFKESCIELHRLIKKFKAVVPKIDHIINGKF